MASKGMKKDISIKKAPFTMICFEGFTARDLHISSTKQEAEFPIPYHRTLQINAAGSCRAFNTEQYLGAQT